MSGASRKYSCRKLRVVTVHLLDKTTLEVPVQPKTRYGDILIQVRKHLKLTSSDLFGLAYKSEQGEFDFVDPLGKVGKCNRTTVQNADSGSGTYDIYLRVQYYVNPSHAFRSDADRKHYYLQLKKNFLRYGFNYPEDRCFLLASYAIHSDEINWREFDPRTYFPAWVLKSYGTHFVRKHMPTITPEKMTPYEAMNTYINELSKPSPYIYSMRLYRVQSSKTDSFANIRIGISQDGLEVYEVDERGYLNFLQSYVWSQVSAVRCTKRKLVITVDNRSLEFYAKSEDWCGTLSRLVKAAMNHYSGVSKRPYASQCAEQDNLGATEFKEAYIYSDEHDLELEYEQSIMGTLRSTSPMKYDDHEFISADDISLSDIYTPRCASNPISRYSMVSRSSSNTTSGIVSDRTCLSTEVSQEDLISSGTRPSICDSLLDSEYETTSVLPARSVTVQRAISEPSKNFQPLRFKAQQSPISVPDYENIAVIRKVLGMNPTTPSRSSKSVHGDRSSSNITRPHRSRSQSSHNPVNRYHNTTAIAPTSRHMSSVSSPLPSQTRCGLISSSPSMEQLLLDYTPPPSYNKNHARQGEIILAASRQTSQDSTASTSSSLPLQTSPVRTPNASRSKSTNQKPVFAKQRSESQKNGSKPSNTTGIPIASKMSPSKCTCLQLSHPEIDKLRTEVNKDLISLPMISALCNDKELLKTSMQCTCKSHPQSPRPTSWHCESDPVFNFPSTSVGNHVGVAQVCR